MLKQKFILQFGSTFSIQAIGMLSGIVVARVAGPEVVGSIAYATSYVSVWAFILGLFSTGHIKLISEGQDLGNCIKTYTILQGSSVFIYLFVVISFFFIQKHIIGHEFGSESQETVIILTLFATVASKILDFNNVTFTARLEQAKANYPLFIKSLVWQIGRIIVVLTGFKAVALAGWNLTVSILALPMAWALFKKLPWGEYDPSLAKQYWIYVPPIAMIVIIGSVLTYSDKLFLGHYTDVTEIGYYSAAYAIGGMFLMVSHATGQIFFPLFSKLIAEKDWKSVNLRINHYQDFASLFIFPTIVAVIIAGGPFLTLILGERYLPSVTPFKILLLASYVSIVGMPYGNITSGLGKFYNVALVNGIQLVFFFGGIVFFLSPNFLGLGATGLALNLLLINVVGNISYLIYAKRTGEIIFRSVVIFRYLIISALGIGAALLMLDYSNTHLPNLIAAGVFYLVTYLILLLTRTMKKSEFSILKDLIDPKSLYSYVKKEMRDSDSNQEKN
jgi:O-antigen/teichoic acid export membrane protein